MRQLIAFSLASFLSFASANAYVLPEQVEAAILLGEDGTPRCRIGSAPELGAPLNSLRECDESDELYAILHSEEISYSATNLPTNHSIIGKTLLTGLAIGTTASCLMIGLGKSLLAQKDELRLATGTILLALIPMGGFASLVVATEAIGAAAGGPAIFTAISSFLFGGGSGSFVCHTPEKETPSDND